MSYYGKKIIILLVTFCLFIGVCLPVKAASFSDINRSDIFVKQNRSDTCTLASAVMMVRRAALATGNSNWSAITEDSMRSTAWANDGNNYGLWYNFSYAGITVKHGNLSGVDHIISLLEQHPEGIVIYNTSVPHAVLATDYTGGTIYCADPANNIAAGRIPISSASISASSCSEYWYVSAPKISVNNYNLEISQTASGSLACTWDAVSSAHQYFIEVINSSGERVSGIWTGYLGWTFNNLVPGTYTVRLDVLDSNGGSMGETSKSITLKQYEPVISDGYYHIVSKINPAYGINTAYNSTDNCANIQMYDYMPEDDVDSLVKVTYLDMGCYKLEMVNSHKMIDVENGGTSNGTNVWQYDDNGTDAQKWIIQETGDGWFYIVSKLNGLYMEVAGGYLENYSNVQLWEGNQTNAQKWRFIASGSSVGKTVEEGDYNILTAVNPAYGLDIYGASHDDYANCYVYQRTENDNQIFTLKYLGNGYYSITAKHSGKVLEAQGGGTNAGTNVSQFTWLGNDAQKWIIKECGDGYEIINKLSGMYLDLNNGNASNESNVKVYYSNGNDAQKWLFEAVHEHQWSEPVYEWEEETNTLTAAYTCTLNPEHTKTEVVENVNVLKLPAQLKEIEEEAFTGLPCQVVIIPEGCTTIGSRAFADCDELLYVMIPSTVTEIADDAFEGCENYQP